MYFLCACMCISMAVVCNFEMLWMCVDVYNEKAYVYVCVCEREIR